MSEIQQKYRAETSRLASQLFLHPLQPLSLDLISQIAWHLLATASMLEVAVKNIEDPHARKVMESIIENAMKNGPGSIGPSQPTP